MHTLCSYANLCGYTLKAAKLPIMNYDTYVTRYGVFMLGAHGLV